MEKPIIFARVKRTGRQDGKVTGKFVILESHEGDLFAPLGCLRVPKKCEDGTFAFLAPDGVVRPPNVGTAVLVLETEEPKKRGQNRVAKIWCLLSAGGELLEKRKP